ncbi:MAG: hypothetical protein COB85_05935 [Bacteroidetes bacterium]|nr:MAG: hypothetical protein COB85_05935 [Bacteroidota bacterium]
MSYYLIPVLLFIHILLPMPSKGNITDSLESAFKAEVNPEIQIDICRQLYMEFIMVDPSEAKIYAKRMIEIGKSVDDYSGMAKGFMYLGIVNEYDGEYSEAIGNLKEGVRLNGLAENWQGQISAYGNLGNVYYRLGDLESAAKFMLKSLGKSEEMKDSIGMSNSLNNIGALYVRMNNPSEAMNYYNRSIAIDKKIGNKIGVAQAQSNVANLLQASGELDSAWALYEAALLIYEKEGNKVGISDILTEFGLIYSRKGDVDSAIAILERSTIIKRELKEDYGIAHNLINLADVYRINGEYPKALSILDESTFIANEIGTSLLLKIIELSYSEVYEEMGNYEKSLMYYKKYTIRKDSLFNEDKSKDIGKLEAKYEFDKEEQQKNAAEKERLEILMAEKSRRNNLQYSGILIFLVFIFAGVFVLGRFTIPVRLAEGMVFFAFLLFFEFTLVLLDPYIEEYSSGAPAIKLGFNAVLAGFIFPLHSFFEQKLKARILKSNI